MFPPVPKSDEGFRFTVEQTGPQLLEVHYAGYMPGDLTEHVRQTEALVRASSQPVGICYEVSGFTDFHRNQVQQHGEMFLRLGSSVTGIAVIAARPVVRFGAITVGLISQTPLKTFDTRSEAITWLMSLAGRTRRGLGLCCIDEARDLSACVGFDRRIFLVPACGLPLLVILNRWRLSRDLLALAAGLGPAVGYDEGLWCFFRGPVCGKIADDERRPSPCWAAGPPLWSAFSWLYAAQATEPGARGFWRIQLSAPHLSRPRRDRAGRYLPP